MLSNRILVLVPPLLGLEVTGIENVSRSRKKHEYVPRFYASTAPERVKIRTENQKIV
jgi:hypothetical protein